ncbi:hypothetical protein BD626DRAFT_396352, partial [Schizophyllum amplum]
RDEIREVLHDYFDDEFNSRFKAFHGNKTMIHRVPLEAIGPNHQEHADGHEKLTWQGLGMGQDITFPIYGHRDQFGGFWHIMRLMPDVRNRLAMVHHYLDLIEARNFYISLQLIVDLGTENVDMIKVHETLRLDAAPEYTLADWPAGRHLYSKHNTPIESAWKFQRDGEGHNIKEALLQGKNHGVYLPNDPLHVQTIYYIWVPLIQKRLNSYIEYYNGHRLARSKNKVNPSGHAPIYMMANPHDVKPGARDCRIRVRPELVRHLREAYGGMAARERALRFISRDFEAEADRAFQCLRLPVATLSNAWEIFSVLVEEIKRVREYGE